jgi:hypothetical protein
MPKFETTTPIPTQEEMKDHWIELMLAADSILQAWQEGDSGLPDYIQRRSNAKSESHPEPHVVLHSSLVAVLREYPDRDFNPALKVVMGILVSEEGMSKFSPKQKLAFIREAAIHATHVVYLLHLKAFGVMRACGKFERGEDSKDSIEMELAEYERQLDKLMPRRA